MGGISLTHVYVAENVLLDARLALFHERQHWLAVADLHYGFELSQRVAGRLVPFWGMESARVRLLNLISDYQPRQLLLVGDLVHDESAIEPLRQLLEPVRKECEIVALAGNHDRKLRRLLAFRDSFASGEFLFHHGHSKEPSSFRRQIVGHFHPAATLRDGAGLRLRFPAFVQEDVCWILPAFSPWAAGTGWTAAGSSRVWVCTPQRIFSLFPGQSAA
jgi:putative SbcD/Mre11-related phosphoesterase